MEAFEPLYRQVVRWQSRIKRVVSILEPNDSKTSKSVEDELAEYLQQTQAELDTKEDFLSSTISYVIPTDFGKGYLPVMITPFYLEQTM